MTECRLRFFVQPRAGKTEIIGRHADSIKIRIKAPPVDGAANDELIRFLSKKLRVPRDAIRITSGAKARRKHVTIEGTDHATVKSALGI